MKLYEVLGVKRESKIEILDVLDNYHSSYVGDEHCTDTKGNWAEPFITTRLLLGLDRYRPANDSKLDQETIDKLNALKVVFDNKGWIAKDRKNGRVYWWDVEPCLASSGSEWIASGSAYCGGIRAATINIPTDVCYDLSKPIPAEEPWRKVTGVKWEEAVEVES